MVLFLELQKIIVIQYLLRIRNVGFESKLWRKICEYSHYGVVELGHRTQLINFDVLCLILMGDFYKHYYYTIRIMHWSRPQVDSVIIQLVMKKSTNNFRKCEFCPHMEQKNSCCCQNRLSVHSVKTKNKSRHKSKPKIQRSNDQSAISYINTTLPITNSSNVPHLGSNILAENSILRTENDYLKRQLHSQYCHVSAFMKDDRNISTLPSSQTETSRTFHLHDKLYASNRNLQQALIELDTLSKINKQLHEINTKLELEKQQLRQKNQQLFEQTQSLKKKIKKYNKTIQNFPSEAEIQKIIYVNTRMEEQNTRLSQEIEHLKQQIKRRQTQRIVETQSLSPEWVAHTSTKINAIEKNLSKLEQENKQNMNNNHSTFFYNQPSKSVQQQTFLVRRQLVTTIKNLKVKSQSFTFTMSAFDQIMDNSNSPILLLIKNLCESLLQPLQMSYLQMQKDVDRSLKLYENKFKKIVQRLENMVMKVRNDKLRDKSKGRNYF